MDISSSLKTSKDFQLGITLQIDAMIAFYLLL